MPDNILIENKHLTTIGSLIVTASLLFTPCFSFGQAYTQPKPLSPLSCEAGAKIIFEVYPVENPYFINISTTKVNWSKISTGMALGGLAGGLIAAPGAIEVEDQAQDFRSAITPFFKNTDLDQMFLAALERNIKAKTNYQTIYLRNSTLPDTLMQPSDRLIKMSLLITFKGGNPSIEARLFVSLIAQNVDLNKLYAAFDTIAKISEEMRPDNPNQKTMLQTFKKLKETKRIYERFLSYIEGNHMFLINSPSHTTKEWLMNDGGLVRQELETIMNQMTIELANIIFQPELMH